MKALIDTNIIIDALQSREPFRESAEQIFILAANNFYESYITSKSVTDIYYLTHRATHSSEETRKIVAKILALFTPLDTTGNDCRQALFSETSDYEDAVMIETAIRSKIDCIVTRNTKDFSKSPVAIYSPDHFIKLLSDTN